MKPNESNRRTGRAGAGAATALSGAPSAPAVSAGAGGIEQVLDAVREALVGIDYGSILITIHQGEVVGIETSTKVRLKRAR